MKRRNHSREALAQARENRQSLSHSAVLLWTELRQSRVGYSFTKEYPLGPYFLDFYCRALRLNIEVDGEQHGDSVAHDCARDKYVARRGIKTVRYRSIDCFENLESVICAVIEDCRVRSEELEAMKKARGVRTPPPFGDLPC